MQKAYALCCAAQYRFDEWEIAVAKTGTGLALTGLIAAVGLVDDVNAALAPDNLVVAVAGT
jgi:hypothetical protein